MLRSGFCSPVASRTSSMCCWALAAREFLVVHSSFLELLSYAEEWILLASSFQNLLDVLLDDPGARVVVLVDPVAEAHQALFSLLDTLKVVRDVVGGAYPLEHLDDRYIRPAVQGTVEPGDSGSDGREGVGQGRADGAHGRRPAVLPVVGGPAEEPGERPVEA